MGLSVSRRIVAKLVERLAAINGTGDMVHDVGGRVFVSRPYFDEGSSPDTPCIYVMQRAGNDQRTREPSGTERKTRARVTEIFDVIGVVSVSANAASALSSGLDAMDLRADIERALEVVGDEFLSRDAPGTKPNLLSSELELVDAQIDPPPAGSRLEVVAVGVRCTHVHKYGDPNHVQS